MHHSMLSVSSISPISAPGDVASCTNDLPGSPSAPPACVKEIALRVLRRTAESLATSSGGLRFVADSRPWLQGLPGGRSPQAAALPSL